MPSILFFVLGVIVGGIAVWIVMMKKGEGGGGTIQQKEAGLIEKQAKEKEERMQKILDFFAAQGHAANDEIEGLLGVSDATATRYLDELEKEGKIRQVGKTGHAVYYEKV